MRNSVSVVIPAYNASTFISETLDSVLAQSEPPLEVIVVNDGSTDNTPKLIADHYPQVKLINQANGGVSRARNAGLAACRGDYIALVDADDLWEANKLARQLDALDRFPKAGFVVTDECFFDEQVYCESGMGRRSFRSQLPQDIDMMAKPVTWLITEPFVSTSSVLMRRELAQAVGGFEPGLQIGEDRDYWIRLALKAGILYVPEVLVRKRQNHGQNLSSISNATWAAGLERVLTRHDTPGTHRLIAAEGEDEKKVFGTNYARFAKIYWYANALAEARRAAAKARAKGVRLEGFLNFWLRFPDRPIMWLKSVKLGVRAW
ncbi:glycosyltransferase family A protein [Motiliproteus sp. SC1-56]|uniref:glycosyltransferase family 2 protein n=1 Tax=Motiliproteus sp. SC1-56 TaxID=2799565 RepID=UPI001A8F79E7|nr:glycosyltransferase family A protein [Motiliproteus sp. SC1-56]